MSGSLSAGWPGCHGCAWSVRTRLAIILSLAAAGTLDAQQRIVGSVIDDSTSQPLVAVALSLVDAYERPVGSDIRSDSAGRFVLTVPRPGRYRIVGMRIGYARTITPSLVVEAGTQVPVELRMAPRVQLLAPLTITARPIVIARVLEDFEFRRNRGVGTFFTREQIEKRAPRDLITMLREVPGGRASTWGEGTAEIFFFTSSKPPSKPDLPPCSPVFFIDGRRINTTERDTVVETATQRAVDAAELVNTVRPQDVYGIEAYPRGSQVPGEFGGSEAGCGAVLIWTRRYSGGG